MQTSHALPSQKITCNGSSSGSTRVSTIHVQVCYERLLPSTTHSYIIYISFSGYTYTYYIQRRHTPARSPLFHGEGVECFRKNRKPSTHKSQLVLIHSLTHSLTHSLNQSVNQKLIIPSFTHSLSLYIWVYILKAIFNHMISWTAHKLIERPYLCRPLKITIKLFFSDEASRLKHKQCYRG